MNYRMTDKQKAALERLLSIAAKDTGQSRRVANFLLAWWNATDCGGFDLTDLWAVDGEIAADMLTIFAMLINCRSYPDTLGYSREFEAIVRDWRANL
jgi:hypothetical protein